MEIQNYCSLENKKLNKQNFGAVKIDTVNLLKRVGKDTFTPIQATFSELKMNDKKDIAFVKNLKKLWSGKTEYGDRICNNFLSKVKDNARYFVTEVVDGAKKKVTNILELDIESSKYYPTPSVDFHYMESDPEIANKFDASPIKGSGQIALYETAKLAKKEGYSGISLLSTNDRFYEKLGLQDLGESDNLRQFGLHPKRYDAFIDKIAQKFGLKN